jgi:hypothetical protein
MEALATAISFVEFPNKEDKEQKGSQEKENDSDSDSESESESDEDEDSTPVSLKNKSGNQFECTARHAPDTKCQKWFKTWKILQKHIQRHAKRRAPTPTRKNRVPTPARENRGRRPGRRLVRFKCIAVHLPGEKCKKNYGSLKALKYHKENGGGDYETATPNDKTPVLNNKTDEAEDEKDGAEDEKNGVEDEKNGVEDEEEEDDEEEEEEEEEKEEDEDEENQNESNPSSTTITTTENNQNIQISVATSPTTTSGSVPSPTTASGSVPPVPASSTVSSLSTTIPNGGVDWSDIRTEIQDRDKRLNEMEEQIRDLSFKHAQKKKELEIIVEQFKTNSTLTVDLNTKVISATNELKVLGKKNHELIVSNEQKRALVSELENKIDLMRTKNKELQQIDANLEIRQKDLKRLEETISAPSAPSIIQPSHFLTSDDNQFIPQTTVMLISVSDTKMVQDADTNTASTLNNKKRKQDLIMNTTGEEESAHSNAVRKKIKLTAPSRDSDVRDKPREKESMEKEVFKSKEAEKWLSYLLSDEIVKMKESRDLIPDPSETDMEDAFNGKCKQQQSLWKKHKSSIYYTSCMSSMIYHDWKSYQENHALKYMMKKYNASKHTINRCYRLGELLQICPLIRFVNEKKTGCTYGTLLKAACELLSHVHQLKKHLS